jgi:acetamidase/formamidase
MSTEHTVESTKETIRSGYLDPSAPAAASIRSGDTVAYPNTWTHWGNEAVYGMSFADREPFRHRYPNGPYSMNGPVVVEGAEPGDVIECTIEELRPIGWGWNSFPLGVGALPHDFAEPYLHYFQFDETRTSTEFVDGVTLTLSPFVGVFGTEPAGDQQTSAILAGAYGGNLVMNSLGVGASLFLPVFKPGGRVWLGDIHAIQGDGVVDQTAIETAAERLVVRYRVHKKVQLAGPVIETDDAWIGIGFAESLDDALVACLRDLIDWIARSSGMSRRDAYALCSMAVSFRVTQFANQTGSAYSSIPPRAVHGVVPKQPFGDAPVARRGGWLEPFGRGTGAPDA